MNKDELKAAVSQRKPPPPLTRGKGVQLSVDQEQNSKIANQQDSNSAETQKGETTNQQDSDSAEKRDSKIANPQFSNIAIQQSSENAESLESEEAKQQNSKVAEVQESEQANQQPSEKAIQQDSKIKRINRGVTLPEDLFREYKVSAAILDVSMHRLMEEILQDGLNKVRKRVAKKSR